MSEREQILPSDMSVDDADPTFAQGRDPTKQKLKQGRLIEEEALLPHDGGDDRDAEQIPTRGAAGDVPTPAQPDVDVRPDRDVSRAWEREDSPLE